MRSRRYCGKAISIVDCKCVSVALDSQHTMRMHRIIVLSVASLALEYSSTFSHKRSDFRKEFVEHKICFLIFCTNAPKTFLIVRRTEQDIIIKYTGLQVQYLLFLSDFKET